MKKMKLFASCLLLSGLVFGCSKDVDTHSNVSYETDRISNSDKLTVDDLYNYMYENQKDSISKSLLLKAMKEEIDFTDEEDGENLETLYKQYLNDTFKEKFVNKDTYKYYGEFDEELLVSYLRSESYDIKCGEGFTSGYLDSKYFSCDYSDYIEEEEEYNIYLKILKVKYLIKEKPELIDKNKVRIVTYYSVARGSNDDSLNKLKEQVDSISKYYDSTDSTKIRSIEDIANLDKNDDLDQINKEYGAGDYVGKGYLGSSTDSPSYEYLKKFTTCGDKRCAIEDGLKYQRDLIDEKEYYKTETVIKTNTSILFESARNVLFSDNVNDYLYKIGDKYYLINPASYNAEDKRISDIILYEGATSSGHSSTSNYYLAEVKIVDGSENSAFLDKAKVAEMLIDRVSDATIFEECFEDAEIEIYDKDIRDKFIASYGDYKGE